MDRGERTRVTDPLLSKMWRTKSARFNADLRLKRRNTFSITATSVLAVYVLVGALYPIVFSHSAGSSAEKLVALLTVVSSVFLIVITLLESTKNYLQEADRMLKSATEIGAVYNRFQGLSWEKADERRSEFTNEYNDILLRSQLNHKAIDYLKFRLQDERGQFGPIFYIWGGLSYLYLAAVEYGFYLVLLIVPPLAVALFHEQLGF